MMASLKQSVATLAAFFEKGLSEVPSENRPKFSKEGNTKSLANEKVPVLETSTALEPELKVKVDSMALEFWNELLRLAQQNHQASAEEVIFRAGDNVKNSLAVNVSKEVYKRELIATLETLYTLHGNQGGKVLVSEEKVTINSLKRRISEMSGHTQDAKEALHAAKKENHELVALCEQLEQQRKKQCKVLEKARSENRELEANNRALLDKIKGLEVDVDRLLEARKIGAVESLRAMHKAEMAELVAKQSSVRCTMFHQQLRDAEASSHIVHEHVDELERVLDEMRSLLTSNANVSEDSGSRTLHNPLESLVHKGSKLLGRLGTASHRRRNEPDTDGSHGEEQGSARGVLADNEPAEESSSPKSGRNLFRGLLPGTNDNGNRGQPGLLRKITSRVRHEVRSDDEQFARTERANGQSHPGFFHSLTSRLRQEPRLGGERDAVADGTGENEHSDGSTAPESEKRPSCEERLGSQPEIEHQHDTGPFRKIASRLRHNKSGKRYAKAIRFTPIEEVNGEIGLECEPSSAEDREAEGSPTCRSLPTLADLKRILSLDSHPEQRSQLQGRDPVSMESLSKTLKSLDKNLDTLRDVVESKEEEIHRLHRELRAATKLSDAFEQGLKKEFQKRLETEKLLAAKESQWSKRCWKSKPGSDGESDGSDEITVRHSRRLIG